MLLPPGPAGSPAPADPAVTLLSAIARLPAPTIATATEAAPAGASAATMSSADKVIAAASTYDIPDAGTVTAVRADTSRSHASS